MLLPKLLFFSKIFSSFENRTKYNLLTRQILPNPTKNVLYCAGLVIVLAVVANILQFVNFLNPPKVFKQRYFWVLRQISSRLTVIVAFINLYFIKLTFSLYYVIVFELVWLWFVKIIKENFQLQITHAKQINLWPILWNNTANHKPFRELIKVLFTAFLHDKS